MIAEYQISVARECNTAALFQCLTPPNLAVPRTPGFLFSAL